MYFFIYVLNIFIIVYAKISDRMRRNECPTFRTKLIGIEHKGNQVGSNLCIKTNVLKQPKYIFIYLKYVLKKY